MHELIVACAIAVAGCVAQLPPPHAPCSELGEARGKTQTARNLGIAGVVAGVLVLGVGVALAAHGSDVRSMESSADDEDGLGALLGGMALASGGASIVIGSAVGWGINASHMRALEPRSATCTVPVVEN